MTNHTGSAPEDRSRRFDVGMATTFGVFVALACGFTYGSNRVGAQPWHTILVVLAGLTGLYALYLVTVVLVVVAVGFTIRTLAAGHRREGFLLSHWPWGVWPLVIIMGLGWPIFAALAGYDASGWLWQGISIYGGVLAILAIFYRSRH